MKLREYRAKRNFHKTTEPSGRRNAHSTPQNLYVIQKHAASHLHYDFRLELEGVLLSWAVPKGPSLDPTIKRLAVHVEDHPLDYGHFQGIIPKGQYGGGTVMLWDQGQWECEDRDPVAAYKRGSLSFRLEGEKLKGRWRLIRINRDDKTWLLFKMKDQFAQSEKKYSIILRKPNSVLTQQTMDEITHQKKEPKKRKKLRPVSANTAFPNDLRPQLATLVDQPPKGMSWLHEIKFDGYRLLIFKNGNQVKLQTRNGNDWTEHFPSIVKEIKKLAVHNFILDGEIVVLDEDQHSNFQLLQNSIKMKKGQFVYYAFDLVYLDNTDLKEFKLIERKKKLKKLLGSYHGQIIRYSDHIIGDGGSVYQKFCSFGLEGVVSKDINSLYSQIRDKHWLKSKCSHRQEFVIGGFYKSDRRNHFRSLMLGTYNKKKELIYHGKVGTGFTSTSLKTIAELLARHKTDKCPFANAPRSKDAVWLKPTLVAEIEFTEWTTDNQLRHPSFKGIRKDKSAQSISREKEMKINKGLDRPQNSTFSLSHPDKLLYPEAHVSKLDLAHYYEAVSEWMLPYVIRRPLTILRCPDNYHQCFFQKNFSHPYPGLQEIILKQKESKINAVYLEDQQGLFSLCQMDALEIHPWNSVISDLDHPDMIILDLDPAEDLPWKKVIQAAFEIKEFLGELSLQCYLKTTGGKGLHLVIPIKPKYSWAEVKAYSKALAEAICLYNSKDYISNMSKAHRKNKIFIDYLRNQKGATSIAPYSTRARPTAPIAVPLFWDELTNDRKSLQFNVDNIIKRLQSLKKDPWADFFKNKQNLNLKKLVETA